MRSLLIAIASIGCAYTQGVAYTVTPSMGLTALSYNGTSWTGPDTWFRGYNSSYGDTVVDYLGGTSARSAITGGFSVRYRIGDPGQTFYEVTFGGTGTDILDVNVCVTNEDISERDLTEISLDQVFSVTYPSGITVTTTADSSNVVIGSKETAVAAVRSWDTGSITCYGTDFGYIEFKCPANSGGGKMTITLSGPLAFGSRGCGSFHIKWGASGAAIKSSAWVGYQAWYSQYPVMTNWPDRRMIFVDFIARNPGDRSLTNPFAYTCTGGTSFNAFDTTALKTCLINETNAQIAKINTYKNTYGLGVQGIILWDYEGYEFDHATTYQGDTAAFTNGYSPVGSILNEVLDVYKAAGLRVGFTIRPQTIKYVTSLPPTCLYQASAARNEYIVVTSAAWQNKFYACQSDGVSWDGPYPLANGWQTHYTDTQDAEMVAILNQKIQHARSTYGATLFYVDTAIYANGNTLNPAVFGAVVEANPGVLVIPEQEVTGTYRFGPPYKDPSNTSDSPLTPFDALRMFPSAFSFSKMQNCVGACWTNKGPSVSFAMALGDVMSTWVYEDAGVAANLGQAWQSASASNGVLSMTDVATVRVFQASPSTSFTYPVTMRVYFSADANGLAASTTYCERAGMTSCYASGVLQSTATLDLSTTPYYQIRYYDFAGNLVSEGPYATLQ